MPGESLQLADLEGPGAITHLWFTQTCRRILGPGLFDPRLANVAAVESGNANGLNYEVNDPDYYRKVLFKIYWEPQAYLLHLAIFSVLVILWLLISNLCHSLPLSER